MEKTVYFRSFEESDADLIYQWTNDDDLKKLSVGLNKRICRDEALQWVKDRMFHHPYRAFWAICAKDTDKMIGYMSLTDIHYINSSANFSGIMIGDKDYHDGFAWIEAYLFILEYAFERLNLNRVYGLNIIDHISSTSIGAVMFFKKEGILRQSVYKNGKFYDCCVGSILKQEYFKHKESGEYEFKSIIRRFRSVKLLTKSKK